MPDHVYILVCIPPKLSAVSYTHLDVYKRQGIYSSRLKGIANSSPTILMRGLNNQAQNLVLVDGQPLNDASSAVVGLSLIHI